MSNPKKKLQTPKVNKGRWIKHHPSKDISDEDRRPKFSLRLLQGSRCLTKCEPKEKVALIETMHKLSKLPWKDIRGSNRHSLGYEKINHSSLKVSIPEEAKREKIVAFRFCGKAPMIGFRRQATFYVLWLDRCFDTYKH